MTNDTTTLNGSLTELGETLASNLNSMGVSSADASDGLTTLASKIFDIAPSVGGLSLTTSITLTSSPNTVVVGDNVLLTAVVHCDYDDTSVSDVDLNGYLQGATVTFKEGNTVLGTSVTDVNGVATYTVNNISRGSHTYSAVFDGSSTDYDSATGNLTVTVDHDYSLTFAQSTYTATGGSATLEVTLTDGGNVVSGETVTLTGSDSSVYTSITNQNGIASFTVTGLTSATSFTATYSNITATCTVLTTLYAPVLDGTEQITTINTYTPTIVNNELCTGCGYLTDGWDNTVDWKLTCEAYLTQNDSNSIFVASSTASNRVDNILKFDNTVTGVNLTKSINQNSYISVDLGNCSKDTWNNLSLIKQNNKFKGQLNNNTPQEVSMDSLYSLSHICIGIDYWGGDNNANYMKLRNIKVSII